jgi:hypothetical protein
MSGVCLAFDWLRFARIPLAIFQHNIEEGSIFWVQITEETFLRNRRSYMTSLSVCLSIAMSLGYLCEVGKYRSETRPPKVSLHFPH